MPWYRPQPVPAIQRAAFGQPFFMAGGFAWPGHAAASMTLTVEQFDWLVAGLPWQPLSTSAPKPIKVI